MTVLPRWAWCCSIPLTGRRDQANPLDKAREAWQKALQLFPKTTDPADRRKAAIEGKLKSAQP
jgi:hypothetical protein